MIIGNRNVKTCNHSP